MTQSDLPSLVTEPRDGLPAVVASDAALVAAAESLSSGSGCVAVDAERASGFRYRQRAYLVQLRREGGGTHLIDPTAFDDLEPLQHILGGVEWVVHAASQDLVCLAEVGLRPTADLFDTELAARLLGYPRVSLGALVEIDLGISLAKEHSAADWSRRPLPESWLRYAALDVEYLSELRELLAVKLDAVGKRDFATQEFAHVRDNTMPIQRTEPWRRTSGLHKVTKPADLAVVRALWQCRDQQAALADIAPGRLLPDAVIVALALSPMRTFAELRAMPELASRVSRRHITLFVQTVLEARTIPTGDLPEGRVRGTGLPPPRQWATRNPQAHARLVAVRDALSTLSVEIEIPVENLMTPELVRRVIWEQPQTDSQVREILESGGARPWQIQLVEPLLLTALG